MTNDEIFDEILKNLDDEYELVYRDYRDEVNVGIIEKCIDRKDIQPYFEDIDDYMFDASYQSAKYYLDEEIRKMDLKDDDYEEFYDSEEYDELVQVILDRDISTAVKDIFTNSDIQGRISLSSNYEAINDYADDFEYRGGYLRTMIDILNLNPQLVKQEGKKQGYTFLGRWPNYKYRNGKEIIRYEDVFRFIQDCWSYSELAFVGRFDMEHLYESLCRGNFDDLTIPKGTTFIAFSPWNGFGGENEFETINDLNLKKAGRKGLTKYDRLYICIDEGKSGHGYTTTDVYGGAVSTDYLF